VWNIFSDEISKPNLIAGISLEIDRKKPAISHYRELHKYLNQNLVNYTSRGISKFRFLCKKQ